MGVAGDQRVLHDKRAQKARSADFHVLFPWNGTSRSEPRRKCGNPTRGRSKLASDSDRADLRETETVEVDAEDEPVSRLHLSQSGGHERRYARRGPGTMSANIARQVCGWPVSTTVKR